MNQTMVATVALCQAVIQIPAADLMVVAETAAVEAVLEIIKKEEITKDNAAFAIGQSFLRIVKAFANYCVTAGVPFETKEVVIGKIFQVIVSVKLVYRSPELDKQIEDNAN